MAILNSDRINELFNDLDDNQNRRRSLLLTAFITCTLTVLFAIFGFKTPLPLPAEKGQFVLVGFEESLIENTEPISQESKEVLAEKEDEPVEEVVEETVPESSENIMETGEEDDAPEVQSAEEPKPEVEKPVEVEKPEEPIEEQKPVEPVKSEGQKRAEELAKLYGDKTNKPKGQETGNSRKLGENTVSYQKTSFGSIGIVGGTGVSLLSMPDISEKTQENADVYIKITVDRDGKVLSAQNDPKRSTTTNLSLINKSIENAKRSKFKRTDLSSMMTEAVLEYKYRLN